MSLMERVSSYIWPRCERRDATARLDAKLAETLTAANTAVASARGVQARNVEDRHAAEDLKDQVRARIDRQEQRRHARLNDPRVAVVQDAIRILEGRA